MAPAAATRVPLVSSREAQRKAIPAHLHQVVRHPEEHPQALLLRQAALRLTQVARHPEEHPQALLLRQAALRLTQVAQQALRVAALGLLQLGATYPSRSQRVDLAAPKALKEVLMEALTKGPNLLGIVES